MNASIVIVDKKPKKLYGCLRIKAEIHINDYKETLYVPVDYWSIEDYERQWKEGFERLNTHDRSCLVVAIHNPEEEPFIEWWPIYKIKNKIYFQNHFLGADIYEKRIGTKKFTIQSCYDFIPPKSRSKVSEWEVDYP
jgi:hypothetical protein